MNRHRNSVPILVYHDIEPGFRLGSLNPTVAQFSSQMRYLKDSGFRTVTLAKALEGAADGRSVALTFDDGYEGVYRQAFPVLEKYGFTATVFVVTGFVGRRSSWDLNLRWLGSRHMNWKAVEELDSRGLRIGSHTETHPNLVRMGMDRVEREFRESKARLEDCLGHEVSEVSYPFGQYDERVKAAVRAAGYRLACGIRPQSGDPPDDPLALKRICIRSLDRLSDFRSKVGPGGPTRYQEWKEGFLSACNRSSLFARAGYDRKGNSA